MSEKQERLRVLARLEVPDCGCPRQPLPCGCPFPCDCPVRLPPPCEHIRARDHGLSLAEWADLLLGALPDEYAEPTARGEPCQEMSPQARSEVMAQREAAGLRLYRADDPDPCDPALDRIGFEVEKTNNNVVYREKVVVLGRSPKPNRPGWDDEMLAILEIRQRQVRALQPAGHAAEPGRTR